MKKFITFTTLVALTMGGAACSSHERVIKENTERSYSSTATSPTPPPSMQERSYKTEERSSSTPDPFAPQDQVTTHSRVEERSSTAVPPPDVQQHLTIERRTTTTTSD
jgi:hypothetical protein